MLEQITSTIVEGLPTTILTGALLAPPAWLFRTACSLVILKRKVEVSKRNTQYCQKLHEALARLIANPQSRVLKAYIACLDADLRSRRSINYRQHKVKQELEKLLQPSIRESMIQYEKEKTYENTRRLKAGLFPILFRSTPAIEDQSLSLQYKYEFARECTEELASIYVFHSNQARDFIEKSPILRFLPFSMKKWIYW